MAKLPSEGSVPYGFFEAITSKLSSFGDADSSSGEELHQFLIMLKESGSKIDPLLDDAELKQFAVIEVRKWLHELKGIRYKLECLIDMFTDPKVNPGRIHTAYGFSLVISVNHWMEWITNELRNLLERMYQLGLEETSKMRGEQLQPRSRVSAYTHDRKEDITIPAYESQLLGRNEDRVAIIKLLLSDNCQNNGIIAICGAAGMGKTTLAQIVYRDDRVQRHFDFKAWIDFSESINSDQIIIDASKALNLEQGSPNRKKFLLVLNDVLHDDIIPMSLIYLLSGLTKAGGKGSRIIVTTQSAPYEYAGDACHTYPLRPLGSDFCWKLFAKHASTESRLNPKFEAISEEILKKCAGLPLAAKTLGAAIGCMPEEEWDVLLKKRIFQHPGLMHSYNDPFFLSRCYEWTPSLPSLMLSYYSLPMNLKRCFAYFSMSPKDYEYEVGELIRLWMAEGFLQQPTSETTEEVGYDYFHKLSARGFFQQSNANRSRIVVHGAISDLAEFVAGDYSCKLGNSKPRKVPIEEVLHLSFSGIMRYESCREIQRAKGLRTLLLYGPLLPEPKPEPEVSYLPSECFLNDLFDNLPYLRVLSCLRWPMETVPLSICRLLDLRYLKISHTQISSLPDSISDLYNLQTLDLSNSHSLTTLPKFGSKLTQLQYLLLSHTSISSLPRSINDLHNLKTLDLSHCLSLTKLPHSSFRLEKLEKLLLSHTSITSLPHSINYLDNLKTLDLSHCCSLTKLPHFSPTLEKLQNLLLSHTSITCLPYSITVLVALQTLDLSNCHSLATLPEFWSTLKLQNLLLSHTSITSLPHSIYSLKNLQKLDLSYCSNLKADLPDDIEGLVHLTHLDIRGTSMTKMPAVIGQLVSLQTLPNFITRKHPASTIAELGGLSNLTGSLQISQLENVVSAEEASKANMQKKEKLDVLELEWGDTIVDSEKECEVLDQLQPHTNLKELSIKFYHGTRFPDWLGESTFSNMVFLRLNNCSNCTHLPPLGQLPSLKDLFIEEMNAVERVSPEFCGTGKPFPSLETLVIQGMLELKEWIFPEAMGGVFPCLLEFCIQRCPKLKSSLHESNFPSVKVVISDFPHLVVAPTAPLRGDSQSEDLTKVPSESDDDKLPRESQLHVRSKDESDLQPSKRRKFDAHFPGESSSKHEDPSQPSVTGVEIPTGTFQIDDTTNRSHDQSSSEDESFESLKVTKISELMKLPPRVSRLKIEGCDVLKYLPKDLVQDNPYLRHLYIIDCSSLISVHGDNLHTVLRSLYVCGCQKLKFPSPDKKKLQYSALEHLSIGSSCDSLKDISLDDFPNLRSLTIWDCPNLSSILAINYQTSLEALEIRDCPELKSFPEGGLPTHNLTSILLSNCQNLKALPEGLSCLKSLQSLFINECPELESIPYGGFPSSLSSLCVTSCPKLPHCRKWGLSKLQSLTCLEIEDGCKDMESFPEENVLPDSLHSLRISKLSSLESLKGLQHLTSLDTLEINSCEKLHSLPEEGLPESLIFLYINDCTWLKSKLLQERGKGWYKIARIPHVQIDGEEIS